MISYNFTESLKRLDLRLNEQIDIQYLSGILSNNEQFSQFAYCTVVAVRFSISEGANISEAKAVKTLGCFVSEACKIFHANESCIDVIVNESMITAVYNTPLKIDMNDLLDDLAMIKSIALVISKKAELENERIIVKIGACYDKLSMSIVESENTHKQYLWRGNAIDKVYKLSENAQDGSILINKLIWNNITDANQKLFELNSKFEEVYEGRIGNIVMNNWLISK